MALLSLLCFVLFLMEATEGKASLVQESGLSQNPRLFPM